MISTKPTDSTNTAKPDFLFQMQMDGIQRMSWDLYKSIPNGTDVTFWRVWVDQDDYGVWFQMRTRPAINEMSVAASPPQLLSFDIARTDWSKLVGLGYDRVENIVKQLKQER
jgi:hypothetical protein